MNPLKLLDLIPTWLLIAAIALLSVFLGAEAIRLAHARELVAEARAQVKQGEVDLAAYKLSVSETTRLLQASNDRRALDQLAKIKEAQDAAQVREAALRDDLSRAADERERLLVAIRRATTAHRDRVPSSPADAKPEPSDPVADVLGQCTAEVLELAHAADQHASDLRTLVEAWPKP